RIQLPLEHAQDERPGAALADHRRRRRQAADLPPSFGRVTPIVRSASLAVGAVFLCCRGRQGNRTPPPVVPAAREGTNRRPLEPAGVSVGSVGGFNGGRGRPNSGGTPSMSCSITVPTLSVSSYSINRPTYINQSISNSIFGWSAWSAFAAAASVVTRSLRFIG